MDVDQRLNWTTFVIVSAVALHIEYFQFGGVKCGELKGFLRFWWILPNPFHARCPFTQTLAHSSHINSMEDRLLGPRAGEKIRDMLIKQNPGTAIQQIKDRHGLNHNNLNNTNRTFSCFCHYACLLAFVFCFVACFDRTMAIQMLLHSNRVNDSHHLFCSILNF